MDIGLPESFPEGICFQVDDANLLVVEYGGVFYKVATEHRLKHWAARHKYILVCQNLNRRFPWKTNIEANVRSYRVLKHICVALGNGFANLPTDLVCLSFHLEKRRKTIGLQKY